MSLTVRLPHDLEKHDLGSINDLRVRELESILSEDANNMDAWNQLLSTFDLWISSSQVDGSQSKLSDEHKRKIRDVYKSLLSRFPNLEEIWKKWSIVEFKMEGVEASVDVLRIAVENFPHSVDLWVDYLAALKATTKKNEDLDQGETTTKKNEDLEEEEQKYRFVFTRALEHNGYHFNSHPIWDKAIEFETAIAKQSQNSSSKLLELYLKVIRIPLYQYAQYYTQFSEINKNFDIQNLISENVLCEYMEKFGKPKLEDLSLIEKHQIIDDYFAGVFASTQAKVSANWEYEQSLMNQKFSTDRIEIELEKKTWINYIDKEIGAYEVSHDLDQFNLVCNLFERALVPNCFDSNLWLKYINFITSSFSSSSSSNLPLDRKFDLQQELYLRANSRFIPLDQNELRIRYVEFLLENDKPDMANEYLFDWIKLFSGNLKVYYKSPYIQMSQELLKLWKRLLSTSKYQHVLESLIKIYFQKGSKAKKLKVSNNESNGEPKAKENTTSFDLSEDFILLFAKFLNDDSVPLVVVSCLNIYKSQNDRDRIRNLFNEYYDEYSLKKSAAFWKFMFKFEGIHEGHLQNLKTVYNFIKTEAQLPKALVDAFSDWYYDFASANVKGLLDLNKGHSDRTMILKDLNQSNSIFYNKSLRNRQSKNNYRIKLSKTRTENGMDQAVLDYFASQAGHPGAFHDGTPEITNNFMTESNFIDLAKKDVPVPTYPTFKNVEKAASAVRYLED
ncbi:PRP39 [Candida oxycetoniae]|uniref:PRP39 n=1 Tax=Candida oxycetoniae TaxID=497107 RepID=A0AAI9SZN7_9ASCO|nr:PRP39 [Candida oxycetoniae]KAI3405765.2 PRP39 [Candida oxycetoniae]